MNKINGLLKDVPETSKSFTIDVHGNLTKHRYTGEFTCKIMTRGQRAMVQKHLAMLNGENQEQLDVATLNFHTMISFLKYALSEMPTFWRNADYGYHLLDENVIREVYDKVIDFENDWLQQIHGDNITIEESSVGKA